MAGRSALDGASQARLVAIQAALVPRYNGLSAQRKISSADMINGVLARQGPASIKKLRLFLLAIDVLAWRYGRLNFRSLTEQQKSRLLNRLFNAPISVIRAGATALNTLAKLGVYAQPEIHPEIGYRQRPLARKANGAD